MSVPVVPLVPTVPAPGAALLPVVVPMSLPAEAARGLRLVVNPQEWAQVRAKREDPPAPPRRTSASASAVSVPTSRRSSDDVDTVDYPLTPTTPESPDTHVQIFEYLKTNCRTEEYVDKIVPSLVRDPRSLKDIPEMSRTLTGLPDVRDDKDILHDLGHKSVQDGDEDDDADLARPPKPSVVSLPVNLLRYLDESRCTTPHQPGRRRMSSLASTLSLSQLSQRLPLPRHLRQFTVKNIKMSLNKLCRRRSVVITESDPTYKVAYLGNVLTGWAKGEGCAEKPLSTLWKNYTASNKPDVNMKVAVTRSGLKATTREHGLTEYWSHRITHCAAPAAFPRVFCWVYRHEGRKLKQELRCHAVLCAREDQARRMAQQLTERLALALLEFRRDKQSREQARLSLANALHDNPSLPQRKLLLSTGASNYRPPLERSKSAPKLSSIEEVAEEDEAGGVLVFGHPHAVARFLREERLAGARRQRFRESLRRKIAARLSEEAEEPEDPFREDPRRETLTVVRVNSIEEVPDPDPAPPGAREPPLPLHHHQPPAGVPAGPAGPKARTYLLDAEDTAESDEGSSSLQSISSDGTTSLTHSHSRTDSGEDFCLGADALKTSQHLPDHDDGMVSSWEGAALAMALAGRAERDVLAEGDDFDDNVSDESGYVEAPSEASEALHHHALALRVNHRVDRRVDRRVRVDHMVDHRLDHRVEHSLAKACAEACSLRQGLQV